MKKIIIALLIPLCSLSGFSQTVSTDVAILTSIKYMGGIKRNISEVSYVEQRVIGNQVCLYEVVFNDSSWCIVPADMRADPVLACGFERANTADLPESFVKQIEWYKAQLYTIIINDLGTNETHPLWSIMLDERYSDNYNIEDSLLDMTGRGKMCWGQGKNYDNGCSPSYNQDCPSSLLNCYETDTIVSVNVYNTMGQQVYTDDNIMAGSYALNLSKFPIGEYIVVVRGKQKEYSTRLIKQKM